MSIIDRLLGRSPNAGTQITAGKPSATPPAQAAAPAAAAQKTPGPVAPEGAIRVYDQFGRTMQIGREAWRKDVLLPNLHSSRDDPEALLHLIVRALNDDFAADVLDSARHLAATDPQPVRGATVLGAVLLQLGDFTGARDVLERALARHGHDAYLLANLARACAALGDEERAQKLIWLALSLDPNEDSSLNWLGTLANARGGSAAVQDAYARAAALPGSWRAQLWLARHALENGDLAAATRFYEEVLARAGPAPPDLLMQMSGDLGNHGHTALLVQLTQPRFEVLQHGLLVGNNLLRAYLELGLLPQARRLLEQLYAQQRPDWREHLQFWEQKIDEAAKRYGEVATPVEVTIMKLEHPLWAHGVLGFDALLPEKAATAPVVHFICGSGDSATGSAGGKDDKGGKVVSQPTDQLGRLTRSLPMFLAEELYVGTHARSAFLLPWLKRGGFVLSARPWTRDFLAQDAPPDLRVFLHVQAHASPWKLQMRIEDARGDAVEFEQAFNFDNAAADVLALLRDVKTRLTHMLGLEHRVEKTVQAPSADLLPGYLAVLEQALAVAMASRQPEEGGFLYQERAIFDHLFEVALHEPELLRTRLLLLNALENQGRRRQDMVAEYFGKLALLQEKYPLPPGPGHDLAAAAVRRLTGRTHGA